MERKRAASWEKGWQMPGQLNGSAFKRQCLGRWGGEEWEAGAGALKGGVLGLETGITEFSVAPPRLLV